MGYVKVDSERKMTLALSRMLGSEVTRPVALKIEAKAKSLADMRAKHSSVADRIDIGAHAHGTHHHVVMSVTGRNGAQIASALEFGYFNEWLENRYGRHSPAAWMPGLFIMTEAKYV